MDPDDFKPLDPSAIFDLDEYLAAIPEHLQMRGHSPLRMAERAGPESRARLHDLGVRPFVWYPTRVVMAWVAACAREAHPDASCLLDAIYRFGLPIFPTFLDSIIGRGIFRALDGDIVETLRHLQTGYRSIHSHATMVPLRLENGHAHLVYEHLYGFPQNMLSAAAAVGFLERFGLRGEVRMHEFDAGSGEMVLTWEVE